MKAATSFQDQLKGFKSTYIFPINNEVVQHWIRNALKSKDVFSLTAEELNNMSFSS